MLFIFESNSKDKKEDVSRIKTIPKKIISLSPSITETLFALKLGDKIIGRTRFCKYPKEALNISEVGGYLDLNYERIVALNPDLIILLPEHEKAKQYFIELNIPFLEVNNKTIEDILQTILTIGRCCGIEENSKILFDSLNSQMKSIQLISAELKKPTTLISIGREIGVGSIKDMYVAGANTYFDELINLAGGQNIIEDGSISYPTISAEGLIHLNPEVIIDLINPTFTNNLSKQFILKDWKALPKLSAVTNNRVIILNSNYISIPGPRFILLLKDLAKSIHPEVEWNF